LRRNEPDQQISFAVSIGTALDKDSGGWKKG
jgi:hypothetical protein